LLDSPSNQDVRCPTGEVNRDERTSKEAHMLWTIFVVLLVLWLIGVVSSYTMGGFIHLLLLIALAVVLIQLIQGRRPAI
jgi:uncharacterized protein DUF5670